MTKIFEFSIHFLDTVSHGTSGCEYHFFPYSIELHTIIVVQI